VADSAIVDEPPATSCTIVILAAADSSSLAPCHDAHPYVCRTKEFGTTIQAPDNSSPTCCHQRTEQHS